MTCKGCNQRRGMIRKWLGIDEIMTKQGEHFTNLVHRKTRGMERRIAELEKRLNSK